MRKLLCKIFGHKYKLLRKVTPLIREIECTRCKRQFGMHDEVKTILPLDNELRYAHSIMSKVKSALFAIIMLTVGYAKAQESGYIVHVDKANSIMRFGNEFKFIYQYEDSSGKRSRVIQKYNGDIEINGDTVKLVQFMMKSLQQKSYSERNLYHYVDASVKFLNSVPDYWKTKRNKAWLPYKKELNKQGYSVHKK